MLKRREGVETYVEMQRNEGECQKRDKQMKGQFQENKDIEDIDIEC